MTRDIITKWIIIIGWVILAFVLAGCKTITKVVQVTETKTEYKTQYAHDTLIVRDSIWVKEKGDTVTIDRWHTRDRIICKVDSFVRIDTIPQIVEVPTPVHYRSGFDKFCIWFFFICLAAIAGAIGWKFLKLYLHIS